MVVFIEVHIVDDVGWPVVVSYYGAYGYEQAFVV